MSPLPLINLSANCHPALAAQARKHRGKRAFVSGSICDHTKKKNTFICLYLFPSSQKAWCANETCIAHLLWPFLFNHMQLFVLLFSGTTVLWWVSGPALWVFWWVEKSCQGKVLVCGPNADKGSFVSSSTVQNKEKLLMILLLFNKGINPSFHYHLNQVWAARPVTVCWIQQTYYLHAESWF